MGKVAEQLKDVISTKKGVDYATMWVGPRDAKEIERTIAGKPTLVPCALGPNINDGEGVYGYKKRKNFMTIEEMHRWIKAQEPEKQRYPCPYCDFIGDSANSLSGHLMGKHKPASVVSTPDFDGAKADKIADTVEKKLKGPRSANKK